MTKDKINTLQFYLERLINQYMWLVKKSVQHGGEFVGECSSTGMPTSILFS